MRRNLRLSVEARTQEADNFGEFPEVWEELRQEWFQVEPLGGREYEQALRMESGQTHKARCAWFDGANSKLRLTTGERIFNVQSVANWQERNRFLDWQLEETENG